MPKIRFEDVTLIYPFVDAGGIINRKEKKRILEKQKQMPYTSNEGVVAVQHFSATIRNGEFVVIMGPSGSGKTSLLRMLAGLERPSLGNIYYDDEIINRLKPEDRDIAMVFQNCAIYPNQTVYDNIAFPLKNLHMPREEIKEKVEDMLELLKLKGKEMRIADELSGGEKQRVAIARALVRKPKAFLLDEPFSNLDELMRNSLRAELKRIQKKLNITFIYVTHDQKDALLLGDRIIVMKDGIMQQDDTPANIYNYPCNRFCGEFVGYPSMNIFDDIMTENGKFTIFGLEHHLDMKKAKKLSGKKIAVGIRPFDIEIGNEGMLAKIDYCEVDGNDLIIHANIEDKEIMIAQKNAGQHEGRYIPGQDIRIGFDEDYLYLFDEEDNLIE